MLKKTLYLCGCGNVFCFPGLICFQFQNIQHIIAFTVPPLGDVFVCHGRCQVPVPDSLKARKDLVWSFLMREDYSPFTRMTRFMCTGNQIDVCL